MASLPVLPRELLSHIFMLKAQPETQDRVATVFQKYNRGRGDRLLYRYRRFLQRRELPDVRHHNSQFLFQPGRFGLLEVYTPGGGRCRSFMDFISSSACVALCASTCERAYTTLPHTTNESQCEASIIHVGPTPPSVVKAGELMGCEGGLSGRDGLDGVPTGKSQNGY
jgi:hypothetical protein